MNAALDSNLFSQIGLDSGSLTILGSVIHKFSEPGNYRGIIFKKEIEYAKKIFYISIDKNSPIVQANIDLAELMESNRSEIGLCKCCKRKGDLENHFILNPNGYALFHVSHEAGGYAVSVEKVSEEQSDRRPFDSRWLDDGDIFSAIIIRPGKYSVTNLITSCKGEIIVTYPKIDKVDYGPKDPIRVDIGQEEVELKAIEINPGQGILFNIKAPSRIKIELLKPDDGNRSNSNEKPAKGWKKRILPRST